MYMISYHSIAKFTTYPYPRTQDLIFGCGEGQPSSTKPQCDVGMWLEIEPGSSTKNAVFSMSFCRLQDILVGGWATPLKNMKVNWDDEIPNIWENKKCSKPPTSILRWDFKVWKIQEVL